MGIAERFSWAACNMVRRRWPALFPPSARLQYSHAHRRYQGTLLRCAWAAAQWDDVTMGTGSGDKKSARFTNHAPKTENMMGVHRDERVHNPLRAMRSAACLNPCDLSQQRLATRLLLSCTSITYLTYPLHTH